MTETNMKQVVETKNELETFISDSNKNLASSRLIEKLIADYLQESNPEKRSLIMAEIVLSKEWGTISISAKYSTCYGIIF